VGRAYRSGVVRVGDLPVAERASCESEHSRGASLYGPCMRRGAVEAFPSGGASYESELERGRDVPSSWPRTRQILYAVEVRCLCCG
jgi:hypothetical protein